MKTLSGLFHVMQASETDVDIARRNFLYAAGWEEMPVIMQGRVQPVTSFNAWVKKENGGIVIVPSIFDALDQAKTDFKVDVQ